MFFLLVPLAVCHSGLHGIGTAEAHPGTSQLGQRFEVALQRDAVGTVQVDVAYVAEVPAVRILAEARPAALAPGELVSAELVHAYSRARVRELSDGVRASWEGSSLPLVDVLVPNGVVETDAGFVELHVHKTGVLPADTGTFQLHGRNFPDEEGYYATSVALSGDLVVTETSLCGLKEGHVHKNHHGAWLRDANARETSLSIRPASYWELRDGSFALPERMAGLDLLAPPAPSAYAAVLAPLLLLAVGIVVWLRRRSRPPHRSAAAPTDSV